MKIKLRGEEKQAARLAAHGKCCLDCSSACSAPAPPDYSSIASANADSAKLGYQAASDQLAFDKQVYSDAQPYRTQLQSAAVDLAQQQQDIAQSNQDFAQSQQDRYTGTFIPVEDQMVQDANNYGTEADQETQAGIASNAVQSQAAGQQQAATRRLQAMGIKPDSGALVGQANANAVATAASAANAGNEARIAARDKGIAMRTGVAAFGRGNTGAAVAANQTAISAGNSSTGQMTSAANSAIPAASLVNSGYGANLSAAQLASNSALGLGGLINQGYGISMQGYNANMAANAASNAGMGNMIGGIASAAGSFMASSSKKLKHDKTPIDGNAIVDRIAQVPVEEWVYNDGIADGKKHIGPYAEDVHAQFGDTVAPGGDKIDMISMAGVTLAATQAIAQRLSVLEGRLGIRRAS